MKKILLNTIFIVLLCPLCFSGNVFGWSTRTYTTDADFSGFSRDGIEITGSSIDGRLNLTRNWQEITPAGGSPQARHSAAVSWDVALSSCLVHGGNTGTDHLIDLWLYNSKDNTWLQRAPSPRPSARYGHKVVNISTGIFLLFGGLDSAGTYHNDAWFYDQHKNTYAQKYYGVTPSSRAYFSMEYLPEYRRVYLFGGTNGSSIFNDLWYYDVAADLWSFVLVESSPPVRYGHGMCWVNPSSCAVVYAGQGNSGLLSDLWSFNVSSGAWQNYPQTQPIKPSARTDFAFLYLKEIARIFLFGGYTGGSPSMSNETWLYNFNTNQWSATSLPNPPPARNKQGSFVDTAGIAHVYGGTDGTALSDFWKFLIRSSGTFIVTITTPSPTSVVWLKFSCPSASEPSSTTIKFRSAHSDNGVDWDQYRGWDGGTSSYYNGAGPHSFWIGHTDKKYIRLKGWFNTDIPPESPEIYELYVTFNNRPQAPSLVSPSANSSINKPSPEFVWNKSADADGDSPLTYRLQVSSYTSFVSLVIDQNYIQEISSPTVSFTPSQTLDERQWYWRVHANDTFPSTGPWSATYTFFVDTHPPAAVTSITASPGDSNGQIHLKWLCPGDDGISGDITNGGYIVRYSSASAILTETGWDNAAGESIYPIISIAPGTLVDTSVAGLQDATTYFFAIKVRDDAGNVSGVSTVSPYAFTNAEPIVTLNSPTSGKTWVKENSIEWSCTDPNPGDSVNFTIKLSSDSGDTYSITIITGIPNGTTYYIWNTRTASNGSNYRLKVIATDTKGLSGEGFSSGDWTIDNINEPPLITVTHPDGGEMTSGNVSISWLIADVNGIDTHDIFVYISSDSGIGWTLIAQTQTPATYYIWNSASYPNGPHYRAKVLAVENNTTEKYTSSDTSNGDFKLDNSNKPPNTFNLVQPSNGAEVCVLRVDCSWENNGDPNPEDAIKWTLYYSTNPNFQPPTVVDGLTQNKHSIAFPGILENMKYYWKVRAKDPLGKETFSDKTWSWTTLSRDRAASADGRVYGEIISGLPENGFLFIEKINPQEHPVIASAELNASGDRLIKLTDYDIYNIEIKDINFEKISAPGVSARVHFSYTDDNNDGYMDGTVIPVENLKIASLDEQASGGQSHGIQSPDGQSPSWKFFDTSQSFDKNKRRVSATANNFSFFTLLAANRPNGLLSNINIFPNPFAAGKEDARIRYVLTENAEITVRIYTLIGDLVREWNFPAGTSGRSTGLPDGYTNEIRWDGKNGDGRTVANGMYLVVFNAKSTSTGQSEKKYVGVVK